MDKPHLSAELINHIEGEILPRYEAFDKAHDRRHAFMVISNSLRLAQHYDVDMQMVYTIAAYHDLGLEAGREQHHTVSARIVREDKRLKKQEEIPAFFILLLAPSLGRWHLCGSAWGYPCSRYCLRHWLHR